MRDHATASYRFGEWELHPTERALFVRGTPVKIGGRAFDLLCAFAEHAGLVISKDDLLARAWNGLVVEENNLTVQIAALRKLLGAEAIVTVPGRGYRLAARPPPFEAAATPLPARPRLVGRERELQAVLAQLAEGAVVSIVGTGGVGKTSLARVAFTAARGPWPDGSHWIDLAPLRDAAQIAGQVAKALGVVLAGADAGDEVVAALAGLSAVVVLDNCEHLAEGVAAFVERARALAPGVRWLATSQEPLRVGGEWVLRLAPLDLPRAGATVQEALASGALQLLRERVRATDQQFEIDAGNLDSVVDLCRQLDGLPLALEMAAARVAALGVRAVRDQLDRRLHLLVGPRGAPERHHSLGQTFDWSYGLLSPAEQALFRRLEPFRGGFDLELACAMAAAGPDLPAIVPGEGDGSADAVLLLSALIDKSLVHRAGSGGAPRHHLLESARDYARRQLERHGERDAVQARHASLIAARFDGFEDALNDLPDADWLAAYAPERHNARAALDWAIAQRDPGLVARLVAALTAIDMIGDTQAEVLACDVPPDLLARAAAPERAQGCVYLAWAHYSDGNRDTGTELAARALADYEALGHAAGVFFASKLLLRLYDSRPGTAALAEGIAADLRGFDSTTLPLRVRLMGEMASGFGEHGGNAERLAEVKALARRAGFDELVARCSVNLTDQLIVKGRFEQAVAAAREVLDEVPGHSRSPALICHNLALALIRLGRADEAAAPARAALRALPRATHMITDLFALAAAMQARWADAAMLAGYGERVRRQRDLRSDPAEAAVIADTHRLLRDALPEAHLAELLRAGNALTAREALALALPAQG